jgi:hypothetical protein
MSIQLTALEAEENPYPKQCKVTDTIKKVLRVLCEKCVWE